VKLVAKKLLVECKDAETAKKLVSLLNSLAKGKAELVIAEDYEKLVIVKYSEAEEEEEETEEEEEAEETF
jgi:hypothetical protein